MRKCGYLFNVTENFIQSYLWHYIGVRHSSEDVNTTQSTNGIRCKDLPCKTICHYAHDYGKLSTGICQPPQIMTCWYNSFVLLFHHHLPKISIWTLQIFVGKHRFELNEYLGENWFWDVHLRYLVPQVHLRYLVPQVQVLDKFWMETLCFL